MSEHKVTVTDLAPRCCEAYGVQVHPERPCLLFKNLLTSDEASTLLTEALKRHATEPRSLEVGERSEFSQVDAKLSEKVFTRIQEYLPTHVDNGEIIGLRHEWHHGSSYYISPLIASHPITCRYVFAIGFIPDTIDLMMQRGTSRDNLYLLIWINVKPPVITLHIPSHPSL